MQRGNVRLKKIVPQRNEQGGRRSSEKSIAERGWIIVSAKNRGDVVTQKVRHTGVNGL